ncbi:MAG: aminotransferase class I/II-fold pyridoxal phosphate-dependent enzyme, partial [Pseudomonadota bacterium]
VMTRTFSKIHGLAALRLGWMFAPQHICDTVNRIRGPFNVSAPAIAAGAASILDRAHEDENVAHNTRWLARMTAAMDELGVEVTPSAANFVLVHLPEGDGVDARAAEDHLKADGILVRRVAGYGLPNALRVSLGTDEECAAFIASFTRFRGASNPRAATVEHDAASPRV